MMVSVNLLKASLLVWIYARLTPMSSNFKFGAYVLSFPSSEINIIMSSYYGLRSYVFMFLKFVVIRVQSRLVIACLKIKETTKKEKDKPLLRSNIHYKEYSLQENQYKSYLHLTVDYATRAVYINDLLEANKEVS